VYLHDLFNGHFIFVVFIGSVLFLFILLSYVYSAFLKNQLGVTSEFAAIIVFLLGVMTMAGEAQIAIFLGIFVTLMLTYKTHVRWVIAKIGEDEIMTTLKFAVISFIILPLLPDHRYAIADLMTFLPHTEFTTAAFLNPYSIWFFVVVMSAVGYILSKVVGANRGIIISGAIGGLVSSTAVTSAMSEKSHHDHGDWVYPTVIATIAACTIMLFRATIIVTIFNPHLLWVLFWPIFAMIIASVLSLWWCYRQNKNVPEVHVASEHESPFQIWPALKFAGFVLLIKFFGTIALSYRHYFGDFTLYIVSFFSGLVDVDAITQDMAERSTLGALQSISELTATTAIIVALVTNTITKITIAKRFGQELYGTLVFRILSFVLFVGVVTLSVITLWK
jgi:uncharacterized membrane protein (DUF4010 family)